MSPFVDLPSQQHVCAPPRRWPFLRRRAHPTGTVWRCEVRLRPNGGGYSPGDRCRRSWRLEWTHRVPTSTSDTASTGWIPDGTAENEYPLWTELPPFRHQAFKPPPPPPFLATLRPLGPPPTDAAERLAKLGVILDGWEANAFSHPSLVELIRANVLDGWADT